MEAPPSEEASPSLQRLKLASGAGGTFGVDDIAVAWATSGGFWAAEGLEVEWVGVRGGVKAVEAVLSGQVDAGYGTWVPCVKSHLEGNNLRILASMALALAQNLVARRDRIANVTELRGKRWAVDGIGALSHSLGQLIVKGLGLAEDDVEWVVAGPPPQRIEQLLRGDVDCSLVRVEEAAVLSRENPELLYKLLGFEEILPLAPVQPHGVISVTEACIRERPDVCTALARGLMQASRSLHDSLDAFRSAVRHHVTERSESLGPRVDVSDEEVEMIWRREHEAGSFAVNGGLSAAHWARNLQVYADLNKDPRATALSLDDFAAPSIVSKAIAKLGPHAAAHDLGPSPAGGTPADEEKAAV